MNPMDLIKSYMTKGFTPKGIVKNMIGNNPMLNNLVNMIESGNNQGAETYVRNMLKQRGLDYDKEMTSLKQRLNMQ